MSVPGSLLGLALGDVLGFVVEAREPAVAAAYVGEVLRGGRAGERGRHPWPFGQYSDDTQLARELLLSIRERAGFDPAVFARRVARLFAEDRAVGAGNGAAMRAGPLGALYARDRAALTAAVRDQALVTDRDPRAVAGPLAIAAAVGQAVKPGPLDRRGLLLEVAGLVEPTDPGTSAAVHAVQGWLGLDPRSAADHALALENSAGPPGRARGLSPFVTSGVAWSLYAFLRSPDDYWETVCTAILIGGDTDTVAAMAGAMSGARLGSDALPARLVAFLTDRGAWGAAELLALADGCARPSGRESRA